MDTKPDNMDQSEYIDNAVRAVSQKRPVPEIDFTIHRMEDGSEVSTQERVCKGEWSISHARARIPVW